VIATAAMRRGRLEDKASASRNIVSMQGISMVYGGLSGAETVRALENFDLDIPENQFVSLIGPSGCGKSTALSIMAGLLQPATGTVLINGHPPLAARRAREIGMVFQQPVLLPWRTVEANCALLLTVSGLWNAESRNRIAEILALVGLSEFAHRYPHELSGGMRQRASIARALCLDPVLLMMDEPFAALDEFSRHAMNVELLNIWSQRRKTIVFITHSVAEAVFLSDRVIAMSPRPGRIVADVAIELGRPRDPEIRYSREFNEHVTHLQRLLEPGSGRGGRPA
jgi:NitT/TauT family transport system ATP-binding protein